MASTALCVRRAIKVQQLLRAGHQCRRTGDDASGHGGPYVVEHRSDVGDIHLDRSGDHRRRDADRSVVRTRQRPAPAVRLLPDDDALRSAVADVDQSPRLPGSRGCGHRVLRLHRSRCAALEIRLEATFQPNTRNTLRPVLTVFTRSFIPPPNVNRFG